MKKIDYIIQNQRIKQAKKYLIGNTILDIGCHFGELFDSVLKQKEITGDGIDDVIKEIVKKEKYTLYPGYFPEDFFVQKKYDNITLLAVMEHIPIEKIKKYPEILSQYLTDKGRVIITIPTKQVDYILSVLLFFKLINGMDLEHHQDYDRSELIKIFTDNNFKLIVNKRFELGLNIIYVFEKQ